MLNIEMKIEILYDMCELNSKCKQIEKDVISLIMSIEVMILHK